MLTLARDVSTRGSTPYAVGADFCRAFKEDMNGLYLLSFLLTADRDKAEECFTSGLEDSMNSNRIFKDWARSWSRRTVIQNAIRVIKPAHDRSREKPSLRTIDGVPEAKSENEASLNAVLSLRAFERFVFVMSVLEHYSDQDCSILLECSRRDVALARARAAEHIVSRAESSLPGVESSVGAIAQARWLAESA
jgi:DNA-directed RNA polymerase specialized sigma24 family protein